MLNNTQNERMEAAVLSALEEAEWEVSAARRRSVFQQLLSGEEDLDQAERDQIMKEYQEMTEQLNQRMNDEKSSQKLKLLAKLEARKKLKEDLAKEAAVQKQMMKATAKGSLDVSGVSPAAKAKISGTLEVIEQGQVLSVPGFKSGNMLVQEDDAFVEAQVK